MSTVRREANVKQKFSSFILGGQMIEQLEERAGSCNFNSSSEGNERG